VTIFAVIPKFLGVYRQLMTKTIARINGQTSIPISCDAMHDDADDDDDEQMRRAPCEERRTQTTSKSQCWLTETLNSF
jgi:hypothetical protein